MRQKVRREVLQIHLAGLLRPVPTDREPLLRENADDVVLTQLAENPSALPLIAVPSRNCALVHTDATVVNSFDDDLCRRVAANHGDERDGRIVTASFVGGRFATRRDQVQDAVRRSFCTKREPPVIAGLSLIGAPPPST